MILVRVVIIKSIISIIISDLLPVFNERDLLFHSLILEVEVYRLRIDSLAGRDLSLQKESSAQAAILWKLVEEVPAKDRARRI